MIRTLAAGRPPRWSNAIALSALLAVLAALALAAAPAGAQVSEPRRRSPIVTVIDPTIERCGPVTITGYDFAPGRSVSISVNGTAEEERPNTDASGTFTFTTQVDCEQTSGFLKIRASDGITTVPIDVTVAPAPTPIAVGPAPGAGQPTETGDLVVWLVRFVVAGILVAELVVLHQRQRRRRERRTSQAEAAVT